MSKLKVQEAKSADVYEDIIRVSETKRKSEDGEIIESGLICRIKVISTNKCVYAILRGNTDINGISKILIDEALRTKLDIELNQKYDFIFEKANWWGWLIWAWKATNPGYKISIRIAVFLGIISVTIGVISLFK